MKYLYFDPTTRGILLLFLITGVVSLIFDYGRFSRTPEYPRIKTFSKWVALIYIIGSISGIIGMKIMDWIT